MSSAVLPEEVWTARRDRHRESVAVLVGPHRQRQAAGVKHPVHDFLFTYYSVRPSQLRRWHPGFPAVLEGPSAAGYLQYAGYVATAEGVTVSPDLLARRRSTVEFVAALMSATAARRPHLSCFGLHEWAMVYRGGEDAVRHAQVPLRLGHTGTDEVVESMQLRCTHFDAFRFFTPDAVPRNETPLSREDQLAREQPGCLHAGMDLYKWASKLGPLVESELVLDCFRLATDARELDMRASPYDLSDYGYAPVPIETPQGRADYVREQIALSERASALRAQLLERCQGLLGVASSPSSR
ncbi:3-methyladenine DNA glycosylase [Rhodococcus sp. SGAir0479]|uniref:3-methyladenine DNA glycosylase n=1 Tax=Rhodococcus sp. SGAir0479 TaxID=2567884 RepID=UPI0010CD6980|nr:3-methyladenine DNA glycosylase [Rhodococcus sp. SGAir0479]QCQ91219.1 3-methyladenine DNA glycosylase [Rhodococcus sp. SGAir0479]